MEACGHWLLGNRGPVPCRACWLCHQRNGSSQPRRCGLQSHRWRSSPQSRHTPWRSSPTSSSGAVPTLKVASRLGCPASAQPGMQGGEGRGHPARPGRGRRSHQPSLAGLQRKRPSAEPRCPWPEAGAICGPTPQSRCASHCSNLSTTKPNCGMQPARSSSISFPPASPSCRQACMHTHPGSL